MNKLKLILSLLGLLALLQLGRAFTALFSPVIIDYCEMMVGGAADQLRTTGSLAAMYAPPAAPYGMPGVQYPPLFMLLVAGLTGLTGLGTILAERLLSWGLYVAAGGLVGLLVWQETRQRWAACFAACVPFCFWSVIIFVHAARVDPLALFLSLLTAYLYRRQARRATPPTLTSLAPIALLSVLAFFSKQTYLAVSAAIFFDLILTTRSYSAVLPPSRAEARSYSLQPIAGRSPLLQLSPQSSVLSPLFFAFLWLFWAGLGFALFGWWSQGELFGIYDPARAGSFILHLVPGFVGFFIVDHLPFILIAAFALRQQWRERARFWPLYTLFATLACITIIKDGAVDYYFNELAFVLSVSVGLGLAYIMKPKPAATSPKSKIQNLNLSTTVLLGIQAIIALGMFIGWSHWRDFNDNRRAYEEGLTLVRTAQTEDSRSEKPSLILVNSFLLDTGHSAQIGDYFIFSVLLKNGRRDMSPFLSDLQAGRYRLIMTEEFNRWPAEVEAAFSLRYNRRIITGEAGRKIFWVYTLRV